MTVTTRLLMQKRAEYKATAAAALNKTSISCAYVGNGAANLVSYNLPADWGGIFCCLLSESFQEGQDAANYAVCYFEECNDNTSEMHMLMTRYNLPPFFFPAFLRPNCNKRSD